MATSTPRLTGVPAARRVAGAVRWIDALYTLGAVMLAVEAAVHVQQFFSLFHAIRWIGPLFLANASASRLAATCLAHENACPVAALAGIAIRKSEVPRVASERARAPGDSA